MARVKRGVTAHARHKKVLKLAKGYRGRAKDAFRYADELVRYVRGRSGPNGRGFGIGVAGFPEGHPGTPNRLQEMDHLKRKVDAGADFLITQLFFDNSLFLAFRERAVRVLRVDEIARLEIRVAGELEVPGAAVQFLRLLQALADVFKLFFEMLEVLAGLADVLDRLLHAAGHVVIFLRHRDRAGGDVTGRRPYPADGPVFPDCDSRGRCLGEPQPTRLWFCQQAHGGRARQPRREARRGVRRRGLRPHDAEGPAADRQGAGAADAGEAVGRGGAPSRSASAIANSSALREARP